MPNKMERFTQRARRVLSLAQQEAERMQHHAIDTEHLLLGLMLEEAGVASRTLHNLGLNVQQVAALASQLSRAGQPTGDNLLGLSADTKQTLERAVDEARRMDHHYIGTEHLLLGLVSQPDHTAVEILKRLGISPEDVRQETRRVLREAPIAPLAVMSGVQAGLPTPVQLRDRHLTIIEATCAAFGHVLRTITQEQAQTWRDQNDAPNGWTALEVLGHLADFDEYFYQRAVMMLEQDNPQLPAYNHKALAVEHAYNQQDKDAVYARLVQSRARFITFFRQLTDEQWARVGVHPERGHFTMWDALMQVATHDSRHLEQLIRIISGATP
ncbi:MAG: DinB family protein [Anaerolineae bacterium]|nr:DinB family protein [Anaerolineae bacterium]